MIANWRRWLQVVLLGIILPLACDRASVLAQPCSDAEVNAYIEQLKDYDSHDKTVSELAECDGVLPELAALLENSDREWQINRGIIQTIGEIGGDNAVESLKLALKDKNLRIYASQALGEMGEEAKDAIPNLTEVLTSDNSSKSDRRVTALSLGNIGVGNDETVKSLMDSLETDDEKLYLISIESLKKINGGEDIVIHALKHQSLSPSKRVIYADILALKSLQSQR